MCKLHSLLAFTLFTLCFSLGFANTALAGGSVKGIYLTQTTLEDTKYLTYLIKRAKAAGINTFVMDMEIPSKQAEKNAKLVKDAGIHYVARIIVFPNGGFPKDIENPAYWEKRYKLVQTALDYGAEQIQLDYIRYSYKLPANPDHAKNVLKVVEYFKERLRTSAPGVPLQLDVFGIASFGESKHIGQNLQQLADNVEALCPMVYPSHFEPYRTAAVTPYETIYRSLKALRSQFNGQVPVKIYPYIEISNYRYPLPGQQRRNYILAEMKAVKDAGADGYYVWSAHNQYDYLFDLLTQTAENDATPGPGYEVLLQAEAEKSKTASLLLESDQNPASVSLTLNHLQQPTPQVNLWPSDNSRFFVN